MWFFNTSVFTYFSWAGFFSSTLICSDYEFIDKESLDFFSQKFKKDAVDKIIKVEKVSDDEIFQKATKIFIFLARI